MYVRVLQIKFPNELAKTSVIALSRNVTKDHFKNGLMVNDLYLKDLDQNLEFFCR